MALSEATVAIVVVKGGSRPSCVSSRQEPRTLAVVAQWEVFDVIA